MKIMINDVSKVISNKTTDIAADASNNTNNSNKNNNNNNNNNNMSKRYTDKIKKIRDRENNNNSKRNNNNNNQNDDSSSVGEHSTVNETKVRAILSPMSLSPSPSLSSSLLRTETSAKYASNIDDKGGGGDDTGIKMSQLQSMLPVYETETMNMFSIDKLTTATTTTTTATASTSKSTSTSTTTSTSTSLPATKAVKLKSTDNKCSLETLTKVSYQRETKANTSYSYSNSNINNTSNCSIDIFLEKGVTTTTATATTIATAATAINKCKTVNVDRCEPLEFYDRTVETETETKTKTFLQKDETRKTLEGLTNSLAERKARLRADFFRVAAAASAASTATSTTTTTQQQHQYHQRLKRAKQLPRLKILSEEDYTTETEAEISDSLIEQRKAQLWQRVRRQEQHQQQRQLQQQQQQQQQLSSTSSHNLSIFPQVLELIQRFDKQPSNMIVNPKSEANANANANMLTIKSELDTRQRHSPLSDEGCNLGQSPYSSDNEDNDSIRTTATAIELTCQSAGASSIGSVVAADSVGAGVVGSLKRKAKVARSASSDSALGLDIDDSLSIATDLSGGTTSNTGYTAAAQPQRRMTLTVLDLPLRPGLLPVAEPTALLDSPTTTTAPASVITGECTASQVPSKVLLEERVIGIPHDEAHRDSFSFASVTAGGGNNSRRESTQSCISDYPNSECGGVRYVRTPSVVVSDYSDDIMCGITLEEIEYFRAQRMRACRRGSLDANAASAAGIFGSNIGAGGIGLASGDIGDKDIDSHSDVSASSSCSNLYYCGSTISALDGGECYVNGVRVPLERKSSSCSACSISGGEDEDSNDGTGAGTGVQMVTAVTEQNLAALMAASHLGSSSNVSVSTSNIESGSGTAKKVGHLAVSSCNCVPPPN